MKILLRKAFYNFLTIYPNGYFKKLVSIQVWRQMPTLFRSLHYSMKSPNFKIQSSLAVKNAAHDDQEQKDARHNDGQDDGPGRGGGERLGAVVTWNLRQVIQFFKISSGNEGGSTDHNGEVPGNSSLLSSTCTVRFMPSGIRSGNLELMFGINKQS
jgi:hypothetical protein